MNFFSSTMNRLLGNVTVRLFDDKVVVAGVRAAFILKDIDKVFGTSRVSINMFEPVERHSFSFHQFFLPDVLHVIDQLIETRVRGSRNVPIHTLGKIRMALLQSTWLKHVYEEEPVPQRLDKSALRDFVYDPLDFQQEFFDRYEASTYRFNLKGYLFAGAAGSGKAQPLDANIRVPGGWSTMGRMKVGYPVIARDGSTSVVTGVFPQGVKEIFKVTFADGRSAECCADHLWTIMRPKKENGVNNERYRETVDTTTLMVYLADSGFKQRIHIDLIEPEEGVDIKLPMDPYLLGIYLGDGSSLSSVTIATPDEFIINEISPLLPEGTEVIRAKDFEDKCPTYRIRRTGDRRDNEFTNLLGEMQLCGKRSWEKFIPDIYFAGSKKQRLSLLQGLMDTDGYIDVQSTSSYCTSSKRLAEEVQYLVRSLGGIARIRPMIKSFTYLGEKEQGRQAYQVNIRFKKPSDLFRLPKKKERANDAGQYCEHLRLRIVSIESVGFKEAQCISIDHPEHLYVTNDFVVTHNTLSSLMLTSQLGCDVVIVVSPNNALDRVWADTLATKLKSKPKYWVSNSSTPPQRDVKYYVIHYEYLNKFKEQILSKLRYNNLGIILDESHNFNEVSSGRTERFIDLCRQTQCENVIWLSGTPIKAMAMEAVPLLRCIDPLFTPAVEDQFKKIFRGDNTKATAILNHRLGLVMFKVPKDRLKLEEPVFNQIQVSFPGSEVYTLESIKKAMREFIEQRYAYYEQRQREDHAYFFSILEAHESSISRTDRRARQAYDLYRQELDIVVKNKGQFCADEMKSCNSYEQKQILPALSAEDRIRFKEVKTIYKYVHLKIQGECLGRVVGKARVDCHVEMAKHLDYAGVIESTQKKTVVFSSYVQVIEQASAQLQALEYSPAMVYAKTSHNLAQIVQTFGAVQSVNPLIATYASLSTAVPLTMANAMILIDTPFRDYVLQQSVSRIHRIGADTQTFIYSAVLDTAGKPNISTRTSDILKWSQQQVAEITGVKSPYDLDVEALDGTAPSLESYSDRFDREVEQFNWCLEGLSEPVVAVSPPKSLSW